MTTTLIKLDDGTLIEVEVPGDYIQPLSGNTAKKVNAIIDETLQPVLKNIVKPIRSVWEELNKDMIIEKAEVEISFGFEIEGNVYIAKSKANANLTVKLILASPRLEETVS